MKKWNEQEATWNQSLSGQNWQISGALGEKDKNSQYIISDREWIYPDTVANKRYHFDITKLVQRWVDNPESNFGLKLEGNLINKEFLFASSEYSIPDKRPRVVVIYYITDALTPTPKPTNTPTSTATPTPTSTLTSTPTLTPTSTATSIYTPTPTPKPPVSPTPSPTRTPSISSIWRVNAGGATYTANNGTQWLADQPYTQGIWGYLGGRSRYSARPIANTLDDPLYQHWREDPNEYRFTLPNDIYIIKLHFVETQANKIGQRVFEVQLENIKMESNLDIFAIVGRNKALIKTYRIRIRDETLNIKLIKVRGQYKPMIAGIEIVPINTTNEMNNLVLTEEIIDNSYFVNIFDDHNFYHIWLPMIKFDK